MISFVEVFALIFTQTAWKRIYIALAEKMWFRRNKINTSDMDIHGSWGNWLGTEHLRDLKMMTRMDWRLPPRPLLPPPAQKEDKATFSGRNKKEPNISQSDQYVYTNHNNDWNVNVNLKLRDIFNNHINKKTFPGMMNMIMMIIPIIMVKKVILVVDDDADGDKLMYFVLH